MGQQDIIDIERLREAARRVDRNYRIGVLHPSNGIARVVDAARFLVSLVDQGGELWMETPNEHMIDPEDRNYCDVCGYADPMVGRVPCVRSRVRVWPKE